MVYCIEYTQSGSDDAVVVTVVAEWESNLMPVRVIRQHHLDLACEQRRDSTVWPLGCVRQDYHHLPGSRYLRATHLHRVERSHDKVMCKHLRSTR